LSPVTSYYGDGIQVALALASTVLTIISAMAYRRRPEGRYLLLMLGFAFFCVASLSNVTLALAVGWGPAVTRFFEAYLIPTLELLMVVSILAALIWPTRPQKRFAVVLLVVIVSVGLVA
jgi:hypothetical protein